ncbi:MAG: S8 family serine peptidase [Actinomycetota bacterium]|nr:S8 family serine peptidase [Actinomycetota bacterium]
MLTSLLLLVALTSPVAAAGPGAGPEAATTSTYIVQLDELPAVAYEGGTPGLAATRPARGQKIAPGSARVRAYTDHLKRRHDAVLRAVGGEKLYDYTFTYNGFAARMTGAAAARLRSVPGVVAVEKDRLAKIETSSTPAFLGLSEPGGLWADLGGVGSAGEDVIVGVVDTGIWPEHPSFSDQHDLVFRTGSSGKRNLAYDEPPASWTGTCQSGERFSAALCTNKLVGARHYLAGFGHFGIIADDYKSARDHDSHGSHTAGTAAGNSGVVATGAAAPFGQLSGMAPRARIAAYKVCWNGDLGGCASSDSVAAIDQAVADGVDVINFSISGTSDDFLDPVEVAFLFAADAGVFVAASAGNSGPGPSTVAHVSPWLTTVAASTHPRASEATLTLGDGGEHRGASSNQQATTGSVVLAGDVGAAGADPSLVALCYPGTLDPAEVTGRIVVCDRGAIARTDKSQAVAQAGGIGMILANTSPSSLNADLHFVPSIHVDEVAGATVKAYVAGAGASATANIGAVNGASPAPMMAAFSSRGPSLGAGGDLLKPDVTAPGVDILAAVSPDSGRSFDLLSGTSMSSPHVAGLGALLTQAHPTWSSAAIKSALMTTAGPTVDGDELAHGAGHVVPNSAVDPGLVYEAGFADYLGFLKGQGLCCASRTAIDASDLNLASISVGDLAGVQTVTRRVTNVDDEAATYIATVEEPDGFDVGVSPSTFTVAPGATQAYTVTITTDDAPFDTFEGGSLSWSDGTHTVRSPLTVRAVGIAAPATVAGSGTSGTTTFDATPGFSGELGFSARGLQAATETAGTVADDPTNSFVVGGDGITEHEVVVPAGSTLARFSLFDSEVDGPHDLDLYVYQGGALVGASGSGTSQEQVDLVDPAAGTYTVYVHGWQTAGGGTAGYTLFSWALGASGPGVDLTLPPARQVVVGEPTSITVGWDGLTPGSRYLGALDHRDGTDVVGSTLLEIGS